MVDSKKRTMIVQKAIEGGKLDSGKWNEFKTKNEVDDSDGNADECCIYVPLKKPLFKNGPAHTYYCVYMT
jgi:hypothetical protein